MSAPTKFRRERKPNFSNAEIEVLLKGVNDNIEKITEGDNLQRQAVYGAIVDRINRVTAQEYEGRVWRTVAEVRKKWQDLKWSCTRANSDDAATSSGSSEIIYRQQVMDIVKKMKKDETKDGGVLKAADTGSGQDESVHSQESSFGSLVMAALSSEAGNSFISDAATSSCSQDFNSTSGTQEKPQDSSESDAVVSSKQKQREKRQRSTKFSAEESELLLKEIEKHKHVLLTPSAGDNLHNDEKLRAWRTIAETMNKMSVEAPHIVPCCRTFKQVRKRWSSMRNACLDYDEASKQGNAGGMTEPMYFHTIMALVMSVHQEDSDSASFYDELGANEDSTSQDDGHRFSAVGEQVTLGDSLTNSTGDRSSYRSESGTGTGSFYVDIDGYQKHETSSGQRMPRPVLQAVLSRFWDRRTGLIKLPKEQNQGGNVETKKQASASGKRNEPPTDLLLRHMKTLNHICQDLKGLGLEIGAFVMERGTLLSCGSKLFSDVMQLSQAVSLLNSRSEQSTSVDSNSSEWKIVRLGSTVGTQDVEDGDTATSEADNETDSWDPRPRNYACTYCPRRFLTKPHLKQHVRIHTGEKPYKCTICGASFTQSAGLYLHNKTWHPQTQTNQNASTSESSVPQVTGQGDNSTGDKDFSWFSTPEGDGAENSTGQGDGQQGSFACKYCGKKFHKQSQLTEHEREHTGEMPFECELCGNRYRQKSNLTVHKRKQHGVVVPRNPRFKLEKYKCEACNIIFPDTSRLRRHMTTHIDIKPYACDQCDRRFANDRYLRLHKERHKGLKPFQCEVCGAKFSVKQNLKVHMRYHTGEKPFKCEFCGQGFFVAFTLRLHRRKHTGDLPFLCDLCGESFPLRSRLKSHRRNHTGEKPFKCDGCGEAFKERYLLTIHQRKHSDEQPYRCSICGKAFSRASHLNVHVRLHTGEKPYKCEFCGESFHRSDLLSLHRKKHQPKPVSTVQEPQKDDCMDLHSSFLAAIPHFQSIPM